MGGYLVSWIALGGLAVLAAGLIPALEELDRRSDRQLLSLWLGIFLVADFLLALSLLFPLESTSSVVVTATAGGSIAVLSRQARERVRDVIAGISNGWTIIALGLLTTAALASAAQRAPTGDVGLYHYPLIDWLSDFGTTPGLALLHIRFGTVSSWFALHGFFDVGPLEARVDALGAMFVILLASMHLVAALQRIISERFRAEDVFLVVVLACLAPFALSRFGTSTYVEVPLSLGTAIIGWTVLRVEDVRRKDKQSHESPFRDPRILVALLAAALTALKISALPVLVVGLLYWLGKGSPYPPGWQGVAAAAIILLPPLVYNVVTSGCVLFPSSVTCLDLPWAVDLAQNDYGRTVSNWARWQGPAPADAAPLGWVLPWVRSNPGASLLMLFGGIYGAWLIVRWRASETRLPGSGWVALLAVAGIALTAATAPDERFLKPFIYLLPALYAARIASVAARRNWNGGWFRTVRSAASKARGPVHILVAAAVSGVILLPQPLLNVRSAVTEGPSRLLNLSDVGWIAPAAIPSDVPTQTRRQGKLEYRVPEEGRCWAAPPPCTPYLTHSNVQLRDPGRGLEAGFVRGADKGAEDAPSPKPVQQP